MKPITGRSLQEYARRHKIPKKFLPSDFVMHPLEDYFISYICMMSPIQLTKEEILHARTLKALDSLISIKWRAAIEEFENHLAEGKRHIPKET